MKPAVLALAVIAALVFGATAQEHSAPATLGEQAGLSHSKSDHSPHGRFGCPDFTSTSLHYYAGDFDSTNSNANGLTNEADINVSSGSQVLTRPFQAKGTGTKRHLKITGLCVNSLDENRGIDNPTPYEVRSGARVGSGGTLVCHGTATSTDTFTGNFEFEFAHEVKVSRCKDRRHCF